MNNNACKVCGNSSLLVFEHTAKCDRCGVLLYYPYPTDDHSLLSSGEGKSWPSDSVLAWYLKSSFYNHTNFTNMARFAIDESYKDVTLDILDYGGGGGQFALVCKSLFPKSNVFITDIDDESLLTEWSSLNTQIPFTKFNENQKEFDYIFLNDVFEHVSDPLAVLKQLSNKLKHDGMIFIDTPMQFWIYPITKFFSKRLYTKVLKGTVSTSHLQIWSKKSFSYIIGASNLEIKRYKELSEYTMPADFYMKNMGVNNPILELIGRMFFRHAHLLAKNKIVCLLSKRVEQ